jgi:hypothetical protein
MASLPVYRGCAAEILDSAVEACCHYTMAAYVGWGKFALWRIQSHLTDSQNIYFVSVAKLGLRA